MRNSILTRDIRTTYRTKRKFAVVVALLRYLLLSVKYRVSLELATV